MNEHAGLGCVLSVLIVVAFTLLFHERDHPAALAARVGPAAPKAIPRPPRPAAPTPRAEPDRPAVAVASGPRPAVRPAPVARPAAANPTPALTQTSTPAPARLVSASQAEAPAARPRVQPPGPAVVAASLVAVMAEASRAEVPPAPRTAPTDANRKSRATQGAGSIGKRVAGKVPAVSSPSIRSPRSSSTTVEAGERLADVAARVYGSPRAVDRLWRANRDRLGDPDDPVAAGLLLRTP